MRKNRTCSEAWRRLASSLPSPSSSSSSASLLHPPLVLDLADELWFSRSVVPFPSFSLPCLPPLFSSLFAHSSDPSTLLAQLMFSTVRSHLPLSSIYSSSLPSRPPLQQPEARQTPLLQYPPWDLPACYTCPPPSDSEDGDAYQGYPVGNYGGACCYGKIQDPYSAQSAQTGKDGNAYPTPGYGSEEDAYPVPHYGEDEDAYPASGYGKVYSAPGDGKDNGKDEDSLADDGENAEHADTIEEQQYMVQDCEQDPADRPIVPSSLNAEDDALSGIYDVGILLKNQD